MSNFVTVVKDGLINSGVVRTVFGSEKIVGVSDIHEDGANVEQESFAFRTVGPKALGGGGAFTQKIADEIHAMAKTYQAEPEYKKSLESAQFAEAVRKNKAEK